ncbi:uncharacterized protein LOC113668239 isoform X5 [Pocillopora damicornis]|uniref:uncharacterized protein LOC113668239 isoform X5 n=1 Tax=Pocillopora damicornis TaxID=46731 RepID=UPI000F54D200|nr:uncharacterized protein LOC113668239 isoform X5 [Pocillopora damicornis]
MQTQYPRSQDNDPKEPVVNEERLKESSSDSESRDTAYEWTITPIKHHDPLPRRKISAPAYRPGRTQMAMPANRRASVAVAPRRINRRGSEAPALTVIARRRNSQVAYPVGLRRKSSRAAGADNHLSIQAKAKHELLANLVLPACVNQPPRTRERRNTFTFQASSMRTKKDEKRYQVAKEILETEKKYLSCLRTLKEVFEEPMRESNLMSSKEIDVLFPGELVHILTSHTHFMKDLEERLQNWKLHGIVGDIFTKLSSSYHIDVLRIYSNYVNNFPKAIGVINKSSRGSHKFRKFLQSCSLNSECEGLDLPAFLLTPIQRLPRYVLLLRQLSKYTDAGHPDSFHIANALETMKQMINILNDSIQSSCKLANNTQIKRSFKRKSLRKKGKELPRSRHNSQDHDRISLGNSSVSTISMVSPRPLTTFSQDTTATRDTQQTVTSEDNSKSPALCRVHSVSGGETPHEREMYEEMAAIEEEAIEDVKDIKNQGQNVFRMAADSLIRNWQRRSKKWRRSTEEPFKRESLSETERTAKENEINESGNEQNTADEGSCKNEDENANVRSDDKEFTTSRTPPCNPCRKNAVASRARPRPVSLGYLSNYQLKEHDERIKGKVLSDPSLAKDDESLECSRDVWIPRSNTLSPKRRPSENFRRSVCSSVVSGDSSPSTGSKKSLSRISQESLADSGVSETPGSSPSNTLNSRTHKILKERRDRLSSSSLTNVSGTNESKQKLSRLNRRSWGDWVSAEMENTPDEVSEERDDQVDDVNVKNKRRFKDVMKQFFSSKKKINQLYSGEANANTPCSTKRPHRSQRSSDPCARVSTV